MGGRSSDARSAGADRDAVDSVAGPPAAFWPAALVGLFADLQSPGRLGVGLACFALAAYALAGLRPRLVAAAPWTKAAAVALVVAAIALACGVLRQLLGEIDLSALTLFVRSISVGVYTGAVAVPILMALDWIPQPRWS